MTDGLPIQPYANPARIKQVHRWLVDTWPPPGGHVSRLRVVLTLPRDYEGCVGVTVWNDAGDTMIWCRHDGPSPTLDTLLHEYAHVITEGAGICGGHGNKFYLALGEIERAFHYGGGCAASQTF